MSHAIAQAEWKVPRRVRPLALERYCEDALAEIERVSHNRAQSNHQRYFDVFKIIEQRDLALAGLSRPAEVARIGRCPYVEALCRVDEPATRVAPGHFVAWHLHDGPQVAP